MKTFLLIALIIAFAQIAFLTKLRQAHVPSNKKISYTTEQKNNFIFIQQEEDDKVVVIYNSSGIIKAGFAGESTPISEFPNIVGTPIHEGHGDGIYIGHEAQKNRGILKITHPMEYGLVTNWEYMEKVWEHTLKNELKVAPSDTTVLLTVRALNGKEEYEKIAKIMFETFEVPNLFIASDAILSLLATGKTTGVVILIQYDITQIVPIYEGSVVSQAVLRLEIGRDNIINYFGKILNENINMELDKTLLSDIIEKLGYISLDYDEEKINSENTSSLGVSYTLNEGQIIKINYERFEAPEILFKPSLVNQEAVGIHQMILDSIMKCDDEIRAELYDNIVLSDENGMFPGFTERITKEISKLAPEGIKVNIIEPTDSKILSWSGASILASNSNFDSMMLNRDEYLSQGISYVHSLENLILNIQ